MYFTKSALLMFGIDLYPQIVKTIAGLTTTSLFLGLWNRFNIFERLSRAYFGSDYCLGLTEPTHRNKICGLLYQMN